MNNALENVHIIYLFTNTVNLISIYCYKCQIDKLVDISCGGIIYTHMSDNVITIDMIN